MSIKRLTYDERATYSLGVAVRRQMEYSAEKFQKDSLPDPNTQRTFNAIFRWAKHWLTPEEIDDISISTGYLISKRIQDEILCVEKPPRRPPPVTFRRNRKPALN